MGEGPSRREFLKTALAGGAFLAEILTSKEARAELEELLQTRELRPESFEEGLAQLRREVFEKKRTILAICKKG